MIELVKIYDSTSELLRVSPLGVAPDVCFGSLADLSGDISLMSAFGGRADVRIYRYGLILGSAYGQ